EAGASCLLIKSRLTATQSNVRFGPLCGPQVGHLATSEKCQKLLRPFPRGYAVAWTQAVGRDMPNPAHWRSTFRGTGISFEEPREGQNHTVCSKDLGSNL